MEDKSFHNTFQELTLKLNRKRFLKNNVKTSIGSKTKITKEVTANYRLKGVVFTFLSGVIFDLATKHLEKSPEYAMTLISAYFFLSNLDLHHHKFVEWEWGEMQVGARKLHVVNKTVLSLNLGFRHNLTLQLVNHTMK